MVLSEQKRKIPVCDSTTAAGIIRNILKTEDAIGQEREHFWSLGLNVKNVIQYVELISLGSLTASLVHPRESFRLAVSKGVAAVIFLHNHPSGDPRPSQEDILLSRRLCQAGTILGINVLDHIIVGEPSHFSFRDSGMLKGENQ